MIEAAYLTMVYGATEVWVKCSNCHNPTMILANTPNAPEDQPFCMCAHCGEEFYRDRWRTALVQLIAKSGWPAGIRWLIEQKPNGEESNEVSNTGHY